VADALENDRRARDDVSAENNTLQGEFAEAGAFDFSGQSHYNLLANLCK
jgi:hypothetical protein